MANLSPPARAERRIPEKVSVVLYSFENTAHEIASTINVSRHGVCLLTRAFWVPDRDVSVRSVTGRLYSRAHVVYCKPLSDSFYSVGLKLLRPKGNWEALSHHPCRLIPAALLTRILRQAEYFSSPSSASSTATPAHAPYVPGCLWASLRAQ